MKPSAITLAWLLGSLGVSAAAFVSKSADIPFADFVDRREPPPYRALSAQEREAFDLGHAVFNTQWVPAGAPNAQRRDGLGPVFNAASCDACHNNGARGQGPDETAVLPVALVIQLSNGDSTSPDPRYGHVFNTDAVDGWMPEGSARVFYEIRQGRYSDGQTWHLRWPRYELSALRNGPLDPSTIIKPRLAPALFGVGLLEAVPEAALTPPRRTLRATRRSKATHDTDKPAPIGRLGWQGDSPSLADQTARAFSREMGLSSRLFPSDDAGRTTPTGDDPEVSDAFMAALLAFQTWLAVPRSVAMDELGEASGAALFRAIDCARCHRPELPVQGLASLSQIEPYTDLLLHDMGPDLADRDVAGNTVRSRWRTAPLWGIGHPDRQGRPASLLHDGRARSIEEAILWHAGEATESRSRFEQLHRAQRQQLLDWLIRR